MPHLRKIFFPLLLITAIAVMYVYVMIEIANNYAQKTLIQSETQEDYSDTSIDMPTEIYKDDISNFKDIASAVDFNLRHTDPLHAQIKEKIVQLYRNDIEKGGGLSSFYGGRMYLYVSRIYLNTLFVHASYTTDDDSIHNNHALVTFDSNSNLIVNAQKVTNYNFPYYGAPNEWVHSAFGGSRLLQIEQSGVTNDASQQPNVIALYDFLTSERKVIYEEADPNVTLASVCEAGCDAPLYIIDDKVLFCRYQRSVESTYNNLIGCQEIPIPPAKEVNDFTLTQ